MYILYFNALRFTEVLQMPLNKTLMLILIRYVCHIPALLQLNIVH